MFPRLVKCFGQSWTNWPMSTKDGRCSPLLVHLGPSRAKLCPTRPSWVEMWAATRLPKRCLGQLLVGLWATAELAGIAVDNFRERVASNLSAPPSDSFTTSAILSLAKQAAITIATTRSLARIWTRRKFGGPRTMPENMDPGRTGKVDLHPQNLSGSRHGTLRV